MFIIGIVASTKQTEQIKKEIENVNAEVICINAKSIENIKNIKFEIIIIQDSLEKLKDKKTYMLEILKNTKCLLLNMDNNTNVDILKDMNIKVITYGLKQKATITASSISDTQVIISVQRAFKNLDDEIIEQQEIPVEFEKNRTKEIYNSLIKIIIINMIADKSIQK